MTLKVEASTGREHSLPSAALRGEDAAEQDGGRSKASALDLILTEAEAAQLVRLSTRSVQRLAEDGRFAPRVQLTGRRIGYWRSDVEAWLVSRTAPAKHKDAA